MKHMFKVLILTLSLSSRLMADPQTDKVIAIQQAQIQAQEAAILKLTNDLKALTAKLEEQKASIANLSTAVAGKILYADPPIGGWYDSFDMDRGADHWCKNQGYLGGVANHQAQGNNRGLFCFR
ncbi:hypothetical protein [Oligoflexus tunisiensis]|uniref:hypothetical protein n=1 Tax=Oligoflexus tunisiensis TaxID=708132 RepID=UPI00114D0506|nr:hypothetical protein [Oligoflexus tunisiensis]